MSSGHYRDSSGDPKSHREAVAQDSKGEHVSPFAELKKALLSSGPLFCGKHPTKDSECTHHDHTYRQPRPSNPEADGKRDDKVAHERILLQSLREDECNRDVSPIVNASFQHPSQHGSESQSDYDPFNGTGQNEPDIESENERGRRAYASILDPPCTERSRIVAESRER